MYNSFVGAKIDLLKLDEFYIIIIFYFCVFML
jgi:hypothetical protein